MKNTYKFHFVSKVTGWIFLRINFFIDITKTTFQCQINIVSTLWITVEITLIRHWKWNKIRSRFFNVAQHWYNVGVQECNNVNPKTAGGRGGQFDPPPLRCAFSKNVSSKVRMKPLFFVTLSIIISHKISENLCQC